MQTSSVALKAVDFDPFAGPELLYMAPPTEAQLEIWLACRIGGVEASCSYNESFSAKLHGPFNVAAFENALKTLVSRHESLRMLFSPDGAKMLIYKNLPLIYSFEDLSTQNEKLRDQAITDYLYHNSQTAFDLVFGPLFRVKLFRLDATTHHFTLTLHHIVCDGWSFGVILQELGKLYSAYAKGEQLVLPPAPLYTEYAQEQIEFTKGQEYKEIEQFWLDQYSIRPPVLDLPADKSRPPLRTYASGNYRAQMGIEVSEGVKKLAFSTGSSLVTTLLVAFEVFLQQLTGNDDVVVGIPAANQPAIGQPNLVGHCVSLLALRSYAPDDIPFADHLKKRRPAILDAYDYQMIGFGSLIKKLSLPRDASRVPLVPVVFNSDMGMDDGIVFHEIRHELKANARRFENFEIFINVNDIGEGLNMEWSYNSQLFSENAIKKMMQGYIELLQQFVKDPRSSIKNPYSITTAVNTTAPLAQWKHTETPYPKDKSLPAVVSEIAAQYPEKAAVTSGNSSYSYSKLEAVSNQLARLLITKGIKKGDIVGLAVTRSVDMVAALLAIMKAGAVYVPIDPEYPTDRIAYMLEDASAKLLFISETHTGQYVTDAPQLSIEQAVKESSALPTGTPEVEVSGKDLAYVLYTSGSTGKPKGVQIAHYNLVNFLLSMQKEPGITPADRLLAVTTISFDIAGLELYLPLVTGATVVIASADDARDGRRLMELVLNESITFMQATPYSWKMMLEVGWDKPLNLKVLCGGEALPKDLAARLVPRCHSLWNMYGPTETTIWSTLKKVGADDEIITIGNPVANTRVYILDERLNQVAPGVTGEIYIAGDGVSPGYFNRPELTAERFLADKFVNEAGQTMYKTGDNGKYLPSGELQCLGRADFQVKIRGYRIEVQEIEFALSKIINVKDAVVDARKDHTGVLSLVGYIVPQSPLADKHNEIQNWRNDLRDTLPDYMVPQYFVVMEQFPLTPNGKINRQALPEPEQGQSHMPYVAPRTTIEKQVADIWIKYMGLEKVGIYDDFFELGGHSLIAVEIMTALQKETGKILPLASLFQHSTVEKLSLLLQMDGKSIVWDSLVPIKPLGNKMPLYIVHGAGLNVLLFNTLAMNMDPDQPVYGLQAKGLNGVDEPFDRMEDIAGHYVSEILAQNPTGPYALAGFSFGGIIAFEMAKQLEARGKHVKMLAMFDTFAYRSDYYDPWLKKWYNRIRYKIMQVLYTFVLFAQSPKRTIEYKSEMLRRAFVQFTWKFKEKPQNQEGFSGYAHKIDVKNEEAEREYKLAPFPIRVELFRAEVRTFYVDDFEYLGWKPYALKGVSIHEIPGEHNRIFAPPNDKAFARILQNCLDKAAQ